MPDLQDISFNTLVVKYNTVGKIETAPAIGFKKFQILRYKIQ